MKQWHEWKNFHESSFVKAFILMTLLVGTSADDTRVHPCLLFCKDNHMKEMESEWSSNFAFPLLSMLEHTKNETAVYARATEICKSNQLLHECLQNCEASKERTLLTMGLEPWREICADLPALQKQLPCWRSNIVYLSKACENERSMLQSLLLQLATGYSFAALQKICETIEHLAHCAVKNYNAYCGPQSAKFLQRSYEIDKATNLGMLKMKFPSLPESCEVGVINNHVQIKTSRNNNSNIFYFTSLAISILFTMLEFSSSF